MTQRTFITYAQVKPGNVLRVDISEMETMPPGVRMKDAEWRDLRVAVVERAGPKVAVVFHGMLRCFVMYYDWRVELIHDVVCMSCQRPAEYSCSKPVFKYALCRTDELRHGDFTCRLEESQPKHGSMSKVEEIDVLDDGHFHIVLRIMRVGRPDRLKSIIRVPHSQLRRSSIVPCGVPICENCAQDLGDNKTRLCQDHWLIRTLEIAA